jgi:nitroreductase
MKLHEAIEKRFSPMIYSDKIVSEEDFQTLLYAATWAASSYNAQPWRFIYGAKGSNTYQILLSLLTEYNQKWAHTAPWLMLSIAEVTDEKSGTNNYYAMHDVGLSVSSMAVQASAMGIQLHQMGGYDIEKAKIELRIPDTHAPVAMISIGYPGNISLLEGHFLERANEQRTRKQISDISGDKDFFSK